MKIALDVDGVLADVVQSWLLRNNRKDDRPKISKQQITDWDFWSRFGIDPFDFYAELNSCWEEDWMSIPPTEDDLSSATKLLSSMGQVDIVTARVRYTNPSVKKWLSYHDVHFDDYVSVIDGPMKADLDYDVFIDDSPLNVERFLQNGKKVILYLQPWNQHIANNVQIHRISNLSQAAKYLKQL